MSKLPVWVIVPIACANSRCRKPTGSQFEVYCKACAERVRKLVGK